MSTSPRIPDDASEEDLERLVAEALDSILTVKWHAGQLHLSVTPAKKSQAASATSSTIIPTN